MKVVNTKKFYIEAAIIIALMFGFGFLPPIEPITAHGMRVIGILLACIYAWTIGSQVWPSLLALIALGFLPGNTITSVFSGAFGNQTLLMVLFCLIFCACVEKSGLLTIIANFILTRKFAKKGPWWLAFAFFTASCIGSMFCGQPAVSIFLWAVFFDVIPQAGLKPKSVYVAMVMIGITLVGYLGSAVLPFGAFLQIGVAVMTAINPDFVMNYLAYCTLDAIICIIMVPGLTLFFKLICPKFEYKIVDDIVKNVNLKMSVQQKITLASVAFVTIILFAPSLLPKGTALYKFISNFGLIGGMCGTSILLMLIVIDKETVGDIGDAMKHSIPWDLYFLLAAALAISTAITAEGTGVSPFLKMIFNPLLANKTAFIFLFILTFIGVIVTNCLNNIVTMTLLIPTSLAFAGAYGVSQQILVALFAIILYQGLVLPSGSILGALLHGNKDWLTAKQIYIYASLGELLLAVVMGFIGMPIAMMFLF